MRVTGSSGCASQKILSIRLRQGGLSFYAPAGEGCEERSEEVRFLPQEERSARLAAAFETFAAAYGTYDRLRIFVDTADTVFVPEAVVDSCSPETWLARMGVALSQRQTVVVTKAYDGVCALFPLEAEIVSRFEEMPGMRAEWYSPMQESMAAFRRSTVSGACFVVYPTQENVYVSRYDAAEELALAEVYPLRGEADMVYYLSELAEDDRTATICLYGDRPVKYRPVLKRYFGRVTVI